MTFLLDANVLIALLDTSHVHHDLAHAWFDREGKSAWATCPLTENAVTRILSQPSYPNSVSSPSIAIDLLREFCSLDGHVFWPDEISLRDTPAINTSALLAHGRVTDTYLLALAVTRGGFLATLDRRLVTAAVQESEKGIRFLASG